MYKKKFKVAIDQNHKKIVKACFLLFFLYELYFIYMLKI